MNCGKSGTSCHEKCGKQLNCGKHVCNKICHPGKCSSCHLTPQEQTTCPCGKVSLSSLGQTWNSCTDPIQTCNDICNKVLPCKTHMCKKKCHEGPCDLCDEDIL